MDTTASNTLPRIRRVRRVGAEWHVTRRGLPRLVLPVINEGPYTSRVSYGFTDEGALVARPVKP